MNLRFPPFNPYIAVVIGVIAISTSAIFVKLASNEAPAGMIAFYRMFFAVILMMPLIIFKYKEELKSVKHRDWLLASLSGIFLALHFILWFESLNFTLVASSVVLVTLQPVFAFIGTYIFFGERFSVAAIISMIRSSCCYWLFLTRAKATKKFIPYDIYVYRLWNECDRTFYI